VAENTNWLDIPCFAVIVSAASAASPFWSMSTCSGIDTRRIEDWLGHRSIQHTTRYTQLSAAPFKDFWR
jgi:hypothetical protein